jgi:hypothetical protein
MRIVEVVLLFGTMTSLAECQLVSVGPPDPHYCEHFKVQPNLTIRVDAHIHGHLIDASGELFRNSPVELRAFVSPTKQVLAVKVMTDDDGDFQIEDVKPGEYRLVTPQARGFQLPGPQRCASAQCELSITLHPAATDTPESVCPAR